MTSTSLISVLNATDAHYLWMGRIGNSGRASRFRLALRTLANSFNNIMDMLQLVFAFVNAPLFATFLLGMFWKRATGHGAFLDCFRGTARPRCIMALTLPVGSDPGH